MQTDELYDKFVLSNYARAPITLVKGLGCKVWDDAGNEYLDFTSGIAVNSLGHCHSEWINNLANQAKNLIHTSNIFRNEKQAILASKLVDKAGNGKVFFCNSGTEANEFLIKIARLAGYEATDKEAKKFKVLTAKNSFHGRTFGGMAATPQEKIQFPFRPMLVGFDHGEINDIDSFASLIDDQTAAILIEPIQGEGGIHICTDAFLQDLRTLCDEKEILLMLDEVQCGIYRTGKFFAFESSGIQPDAIAMAKGLGGGFPIGAVWLKEKISQLVKPGMHGCTFGGSPLACTAALSVIEIVEKEGLLSNVNNLSEKWHAGFYKVLEKFPQLIKSIRASGFLVGVELISDMMPVIKNLRENGLLTVGAGGNTIRFLPPFMVTEYDLDQSINILNNSLSNF